MKTKKISLTILCTILILNIIGGCSNNSSSTNEQANTQTLQLSEIVNDTYFDSAIAKYKGLTFGEVINELINNYPDKNDVIYRTNEKITNWETIKSKLSNFDSNKYDYISVLIKYKIEFDFQSVNILFSIDKITNEVTPISYSSNNDDWTFGVFTEENIINICYTFFYIATTDLKNSSSTNEHVSAQPSNLPEDLIKKGIIGSWNADSSYMCFFDNGKVALFDEVANKGEMMSYEVEDDTITLYGKVTTIKLSNVEVDNNALTYISEAGNTNIWFAVSSDKVMSILEKMQQNNNY